MREFTLIVDEYSRYTFKYDEQTTPFKDAMHSAMVLMRQEGITGEILYDYDRALVQHGE